MQDHDRKNDAGMSRFVPRADRHGVASSTALASQGRGECQGKQESPRQPGAFCFNSWWSRRDLNPRPCACKAPALPLRHATEHITRLNARVRIVPQVPRRSKWKAGRRDDSASRAHHSAAPTAQHPAHLAAQRPRRSVRRDPGTAPTAQRAALSRHGAHGATSAQRPRHCRRRRRWSRASGPPRAP